MVIGADVEFETVDAHPDLSTAMIMDSSPQQLTINGTEEAIHSGTVLPGEHCNGVVHIHLVLRFEV